MHILEDGFVEIQDVKIHYLASKQMDLQKLSLLFVPGIMMPGWIWDHQLKYFSENYNVIAMDPRSQGSSSQSFEGHYAYSMAKDIKAVVDKLNLDRFVVVGWSIGVPQVINYAAHFASKGLMGLVLVDGIVGIDPSVSFYDSMLAQWSQFQFDRIPNTEKFVKVLFKQPQKEEYFEQLKEVALRTPTNTVMTLINNYILQDFRSLLPNIDMPILMTTIQGPRLEYMQQMQSLFPSARLEIFESAGHALFVDEPERFNRVLDLFIEDLFS